MNIVDLETILKGDIARIDEVNITDIALYQDNIFVYPKDIKVMLEKYLVRDITLDELSKWAGFLSVRGEYSSPKKTDDRDEDFYDVMWDVIHALSVPEIDGEINTERVREYLVLLKKYDNA